MAKTKAQIIAELEKENFEMFLKFDNMLQEVYEENEILKRLLGEQIRNSSLLTEG